MPITRTLSVSVLAKVNEGCQLSVTLSVTQSAELQIYDDLKSQLENIFKKAMILTLGFVGSDRGGTTKTSVTLEPTPPEYMLRVTDNPECLVSQYVNHLYQHIKYSMWMSPFSRPGKEIFLLFLAF
jgi:hypothetical protein